MLGALHRGPGLEATLGGRRLAGGCNLKGLALERRYYRSSVNMRYWLNMRDGLEMFDGRR